MKACLICLAALSGARAGEVMGSALDAGPLADGAMPHQGESHDLGPFEYYTP